MCLSTYVNTYVHTYVDTNIQTYIYIHVLYRIINNKIDCRVWISIRNNLLVNIYDELSKECNIFMEHVKNGFITVISSAMTSETSLC